jgi:hypothetical protein
MKKKLAWLCLLVSPLVLGGAAFCLSDRDPITKANCDRIKEGMTEKEVVAILGRKWDVEASLGGDRHAFQWDGSRGTIDVRMEKAVVDSAFFMPGPPQTVFEKVIDWLGL